jgi:uncharacterized membrane protein YeaQ/YmgE (transglycosylase-associated protein family)
MEILWFVLIGLAAGWIAGKLMKSPDYGLVGDLVVGICGALLGGLVFRLLGQESVGWWGRLVAAIVGAMLVIWLIRRLAGRRRRRRSR